MQQVELETSLNSFEGLKTSLTGGVLSTEKLEQQKKEYVREVDALGRSYATGKRKDSIARVWIKPGKGVITVNGRSIDAYFARPVLRMIINQPFASSKTEGQFDVMCTVSGGGLSGQAGAVRHAISWALLRQTPDLRAPLKQGGFFTRDSRRVERKKYGLHGARRGCQFSKR